TNPCKQQQEHGGYADIAADNQKQIRQYNQATKQDQDILCIYSTHFVILSVSTSYLITSNPPQTGFEFRQNTILLKISKGDSCCGKLFKSRPPVSLPAQ